MKCLPVKIFFLCFVLFLASFLPVQTVGQDVSTQDIDLQIYAFEKAYQYFKDDGIFFDGHQKSLNRVIDDLTKKFAPGEFHKPVLSDDENINLGLVKDYIKFLNLNNHHPSQDVIRAAIRAMLKVDFYAAIKTYDNFRAELKETVGVYEDDGLFSTFQDGKFFVLITLPQSSSDEAGFQPGDEILKINNISFIGIKDEDDLDDRLNQLGDFKLGQEVVYLIRRGQEEFILKTKIVKIGAKIWVNTYKASNDIGVIRIKEFSMGSGSQFIEQFKELEQSSVKAIIIDLRNNPGGYVYEALQITKFLTGQGFKFKLSKNREQIYNNENLGIVKTNFSGSVAVLVNFWSASAAEILAAVLQENGALIFGHKTLGKNFGQGHYLLPNKDYLRFSKFWAETLGGKSWPSGIQPDIKTDYGKELSEAVNYLKDI